MRLDIIRVSKGYMSRIIQLFITFLRIGAFTFGGGYAMIPLIQKEVSQSKKWLSEQEILEVVAIAETTPGPIAVNMATFVGYKVAKEAGAIVATIGVVIPSFAIIMLIVSLFNRYMEYPIVQNAFWGVRIAVLALIIKAFVSMLKACPKNYLSYIVACLSFIAVAILNINALIVIAIAALCGVVIQGIVRSNKL